MKTSVEKKSSAATSIELISPFPDGDLSPSTSIFTEGSRGSTHRISQEFLYEVAQNYVQYYAHGESHTARAKRYDLQYFLEFLAGSKSKVEQLAVSAWTVQRTKDYIDSRLALGEAPATVSRRLATIKHFGRTLAERVPGYINPAREVKGPVLSQTRPQGLGPEEVELMKAAALAATVEKGSNFAALRDRYLLELLLATGLRADEVRLLVMAQVSADLYWLKNVKTKGKRYRNVYLDSHIRDQTASYLETREKALKERYPGVELLTAQEQSRLPMLVSFYRAKLTEPQSFGLSPKTIFNAIANVGKKAEALSPSPMSNLHPHRLRHTFAHGLLDSSKDVRLVAQALGHSDVRTTMRYTERTEQEVASAIEEKILLEERRKSA